MILSKGALKAIEMLNNAGYEAYAVGGCVRDAIMGIEINDFDVTTSATPEEMQQVFKIVYSLSKWILYILVCGAKSSCPALVIV